MYWECLGFDQKPFLYIHDSWHFDISMLHDAGGPESRPRSATEQLNLLGGIGGFYSIKQGFIFPKNNQMHAIKCEI